MIPDDSATKGLTVWFTGLSASGKSTLARALKQRLHDSGYTAEILDGDEIRKTVSAKLGFSRKDREENVRRIAEIAKVLTRNQVIAIVAAISPYRESRDYNRQQLQSFVEVYVRCPLEVVEARDPKGIYKRARNGEIKQVTGLDDPYEEPLNPEVIVNTDSETVATSLDKVWNYLKNSHRLPPPANS